MYVLTFNSGSSSLKFGLYRVIGDAPSVLVDGEIESLGDGRCRIRASHATGGTIIDETVELAEPAQGVGRIAAVLGSEGMPTATAIGHRIAHGGPTLRRHCLIDPGVVATLTAAVAFAPLHLPAALSVIRYTGEHFRGVPQAACLDTEFHADMPATATMLPLPAALRALGLQRYGFHGLSCESIMIQLGRPAGDRTIVAHLGNGASITAVRQGRSIDTSMGLTPSGGIIMGTRTGDIDPGVLLYLLRQKIVGADQLEDIIDRRSGLLGLSGISGDVRRLAEGGADARLALDMFQISAAKQIAGMIVALGGVDTLVFTGGIGEHDAGMRAGIVGRLSCLGVAFDAGRNEGGQNPLNPACGKVAVMALPSREDEVIAHHTARLAARLPDPGRAQPVQPGAA